MRFSGQTALITGGASGLGLAVARLLASEGASLVLVDWDGDALEAAAGALGASRVQGDASEWDTAKAAVDLARSAFGRLDVLFNNAGIDPLRARSVVETAEADWDRVMDVNVRSAYVFTRAAIPLMREGGGGSIVNTASIAGLIGLVTSSAYVAAKHGVIGLTKTAALEYTDVNIRVNAVCPGFIKTQMTADTMRRRGETIISQIPFRRMGEPGEIAEMVVWLCSERASYVTGASYNVDGGWMAV